MDGNVSSGLSGSEIHGFRTIQDLEVGSMMVEARSRWLRPNEIHAILCNPKHFIVNVKPISLPKSGTIVLFDRKMLRNFRKDGHNWKKKKDGKTVKEAHEHLKVGNEERIHVYYAHGEDNQTFVRRCYWLLDKALEHIVLVHYRETQEVSPDTSVNSNYSQAVSDPSASLPLLEELDSAVDRFYFDGKNQLLERHGSLTVKNHELKLHEINTLEWDELLAQVEAHKLNIPHEGKILGFDLPNHHVDNFRIYGDTSLNKVSPESSASNANGHVAGNQSISYDVYNNISFQTLDVDAFLSSSNMISESDPMGVIDSSKNLGKNGLHAQESMGRWMTYIVADSPDSVNDKAIESSVSTGHQSFTSPRTDDRRPSLLGQIFNITHISPAWGLATEETKILVVGNSTQEGMPNLEGNLFLACGDFVVPAEAVQTGVFQCSVPPQTPGFVNFYLCFGDHKPISQVLTFEFRVPEVPSTSISLDNKSQWEKFELQIRLSHLLFSSSKGLNIFSSKLPPNDLKEARTFTQKTSQICDNWVYLTKMILDPLISLHQAKDNLFELTLQNRLQEWLLEKVVTGCKISERDEKGQGVIHLCAILDYTWAVYPFSCSGLSLDYRDKFGWTALHWAAYYGREKMVAALLSAGSKPSLVTDPTTENPGGFTAADLASKQGFDGLAAFLAEKALISHFNDMTLAGNVSGALQTTASELVNSENFSEEEMYLKDALTAYRTAADAAARIHAAFREHSFKIRTKAVQSCTPEMEARGIVAAMKIQHAYRNYETRKQIAAAARIQYRFRSWKMRKDFLNLRRHTIKIQSVFRAFQARKQYCKILWSVGILEKAVLRWRMKRKGFRGIQAPPGENPENLKQESDAEEDFFHASRKQAEERVERSVIRVQAMFRSKQAQEEYRRMKLVHCETAMEYKGLLHPVVDMQ